MHEHNCTNTLRDAFILALQFFAFHFLRSEFEFEFVIARNEMFIRNF